MQNYLVDLGFYERRSYDTGMCSHSTPTLLVVLHRHSFIYNDPSAFM